MLAIDVAALQKHIVSHPLLITTLPIGTPAAISTPCLQHCSGDRAQQAHSSVPQRPPAKAATGERRLLARHSAAIPAFKQSGGLLPSLQLCHSHAAEAYRLLSSPGHSRLHENPWTCHVQARAHFRRDCNAGGSLVRRGCTARGGDVRLPPAERVPESSKGSGTLAAPEACCATRRSSTAASCAYVDADPGTAVNGHASASRASYLQSLGPLGFEELLEKIELAHRQVTGHSVLSKRPRCSYAKACSSTDLIMLSL